MKRVIFCLWLVAFALLGAEPVFRHEPEFRVPVRSAHELQFQVEVLPVAGHSLLLEFDARIDFPPGFGGYHSKALLPYVNGKLVPVDSYLNCPMEYRFINGHTGEPGRWNPPKVSFNSIKTGNKWEDNVLKNGGNYYALVYARDFESIDTPRNKYSSKECSRCHFVLNITDLCKVGENQVVFYSAVSPANVKDMGGSLTNPDNPKGSLPIVVRNVVVQESDQAQSRRQPFWLAEIEDISRQMPTVEPRRDFTENYQVRFGQAGAVIVTIGESEYRVHSYYSYPDQGKFNRIPAGKGQEDGWVARNNANDLRFDGQGAFYAVHRTIDKQPGYFEIRDTLENLTDEPQGVMVRYEVPFQLISGQNCIYNSGLKVTEKLIDNMYFPENPTFFLQSGQGGLGLIPGDDVLRIQSRNWTVPGAVQIRDDQLMLAPRKSITLRLQVYPVERGDYFTFINQVRQAWNMNGETADGFFRSAVAMPKPGWKTSPGMGALHVHVRNKGAWAWGLSLAENHELHAEAKKIVAAYKQIVPPNVRVFANYMAIYFSNATGDDLKRFGDCVVVNKDGTFPMEANCRFYIATRENDFGKMVTSTVDMMMDDWKADGIYFDYLEGADPYFTYNQTDGVSCDIDQKTGRLLRQKGSYQLLSQDYVIWLMKRVSGKGLPIHANRNPFTWTTTTSLKKETSYRLTECGYPDQLVRGHLGFIPLGLQRTFANRVHLQLVRALYEGMVSIPYDTRYQWEDNPAAATYPFTFRELRRGCAIGDNKMVTAIGGVFGWGDKSDLRCRIYDSTGRLKDAKGGEPVQRDGQNYLRVQLAPLEVAVIERLPKK